MSGTRKAASSRAGDGGAKTARVGRRIDGYALASIICLALVCVVTSSVCSARIPLEQTSRLLLEKLPLVGAAVDTSDINPNYETILYRVRIPRVLMAVIVGISLSEAGVMY